VDRSAQPVDRFCLLDETRAIGCGESTRIGEAAECQAVLLEVRDVGFVGDGDDYRFSAFFAFSERELLYAVGSSGGDGVEVPIEIGDVGEAAEGSWDVAQNLQWRRDCCGGGKGRDEFCCEFPVRIGGCQLADLGGVDGIDRLLGGGARRKGGASEESERGGESSGGHRESSGGRRLVR